MICLMGYLTGYSKVGKTPSTGPGTLEATNNWHLFICLIKTNLNRTSVYLKDETLITVTHAILVINESKTYNMLSHVPGM